MLRLEIKPFLGPWKLIAHCEPSEIDSALSVLRGLAILTERPCRIRMHGTRGGVIDIAQVATDGSINQPEDLTHA